MAPPVLRMKLEVHRLLQYRDVRGQWTVAIRLKANDIVTGTCFDALFPPPSWVSDTITSDALETGAVARPEP